MLRSPCSPQLPAQCAPSALSTILPPNWSAALFNTTEVVTDASSLGIFCLLYEVSSSSVAVDIKLTSSCMKLPVMLRSPCSPHVTCALSALSTSCSLHPPWAVSVLPIIPQPDGSANVCHKTGPVESSSSDLGCLSLGPSSSSPDITPSVPWSSPP